MPEPLALAKTAADGWLLRESEVITLGEYAAQLAEALTTARREGAEQGWDECVDYFAILGPLNGHDRIKGYVLDNAREANPYEPYNADKIAKGDDE